MSMLAEPKRKQRWSLNPRGKLWTEDTTNFGHKMLEKMGWKHGKGLGANEDGVVESLKVSYKNDSKGLGHEETEGWTMHDNNFSSLLENLNGKGEEVAEFKEVTSLQEKVKKSRVRINYHKFTKAKDLSRYSEKDLANIFGKKSLKETPPEADQEVITDATHEEQDTSLVNRGSMADYFKSKLPNFSRYNSNFDASVKNDMSGSESERGGFGFGFSPACNEENLYNQNDIQSKKKKTKFVDTFLSHLDKDHNTEDVEEPKEKRISKCKTNSNFISYIFDYGENIKNNEEHTEKTNDLLVRTCKKKRTKNQFNEGNLIECEDGMRNVEDFVNCEENGKEVFYEVTKKKLKRSGLKHEENVEIIDEENANKCKKKKPIKNLKGDHMEELQEEDLKINHSNKKKSKKKKKGEDDMGISNVAFQDFQVNDLNHLEIENDRQRGNNEEEVKAFEDIIKEVTKRNKSKKKSKKDKNKDLELDENGEMIKNFEENEGCTRKKSKKERIEENIGISNTAFTDIIENQSLPDISVNEECQNSEEITKRKKKKRKYEDISSDGIDNPVFDDVKNDSSTSETTPNPYEIKKKKKKKLSDKEESGLDNPALNISDVIEDGDLILNVVSTPIILKKPVKKDEFNINMGRNRSAKRKSVRFSDVLQERIIPNDPSERINEYISNRNELFDINNMVIQEGMKEEMEKQGMSYEAGCFETSDMNSVDSKEINRKMVESSVKEELKRGLKSQSGFVNNGFDIRTIDRMNFNVDRYEVPSSNGKGIDNKAFNRLKNHIDENIETISNTIERYQAEVENDINENKDSQNLQVKSGSHQQNTNDEWLVGDVGTQISQNIKLKTGLKLCFREMHFKTRVPSYLRSNVSVSKKTYRHLIRGDVTLAFKNTNLHEIQGYAVKPKKKLKLS